MCLLLMIIIRPVTACTQAHEWKRDFGTFYSLWWSCWATCEIFPLTWWFTLFSQSWKSFQTKQWINPSSEKMTFTQLYRQPKTQNETIFSSVMSFPIINIKITSDDSMDIRFDFNMQSRAESNPRRVNSREKLSSGKLLQPLREISRWLLLIANREIDLRKTIFIMFETELRTLEVVIEDWNYDEWNGERRNPLKYYGDWRRFLNKARTKKKLIVRVIALENYSRLLLCNTGKASVY